MESVGLEWKHQAATEIQGWYRHRKSRSDFFAVTVITALEKMVQQRSAERNNREVNLRKLQAMKAKLVQKYGDEAVAQAERAAVKARSVPRSPLSAASALGWSPLSTDFGSLETAVTIVKVERRLDESDGRTYTKAEFDGVYGVDSDWFWDNSKPPERRIDRSDGKAYTKSEFDEVYGAGSDWFWGRAMKDLTAHDDKVTFHEPSDETKDGEVEEHIFEAEATKAQMPPATSNLPDERRIDGSDGVAYTRLQFTEAYGTADGEWIWDHAEKDRVEMAVSFDVSLQSQTVESFDAAAQDTFTAATASALGLQAQHVSITSVRAGSAVVATRVTGLADAAAANTLAAKVSDPQTLAQGIAGAGLGACTVSTPVVVAEVATEDAARETRVDPHDGNLYTKAEFFEAYEDHAVWKTASKPGTADDKPSEKLAAASLPAGIFVVTNIVPQKDTAKPVTPKAETAAELKAVAGALAKKSEPPQSRLLTRMSFLYVCVWRMNLSS
jgi:hypothetical protein